MIHPEYERDTESEGTPVTIKVPVGNNKYLQASEYEGVTDVD